MNRKKILVVEDNEDNRRILVYRLRKIGDFEIFEAQNGLEAIEMTEILPEIGPDHRRPEEHDAERHNQAK